MRNTIKLNKEQAEMFLIMAQLAQLSKMCLNAESKNLDAFPLSIKGRCPAGSKGVVIKGKPRLMAEFVSEEIGGWIGAVKCEDYRSWLKKTYDDTPEKLKELFEKKQASQ